MMNIVILAAGMGKRMYSALPKVLHKIAGKPLIAHAIETAQKLSPHKLIIVVGHGAEAVQAALGKLGHSDIHFVYQAEQLGTAHAVQQALPLLDPSLPTLVLYGDVPLITDQTLTDLLNKTPVGGYGILTAILDNPQGYGRIVRDEEGHVARIVEQKDAQVAELAIQEVNTGVMMLPTQYIAAWLASIGPNNAQGEFYLTDLVECALKAGISIATTQVKDAHEILGVNNKTQLAELERIYQRRIAEKLLEAGVTLCDANRLDVRGELICGSDVTIDVNVIFEGKVRLGDDVYIGPNCVICTAEIGSGSRIEAFTHIVGAVLQKDVHIGPYARLRPGTLLCDEVHIGNFVEIKNSQIGPGSKANHLSYLGDADIGAQVNIGAGTITCNYDGANKYRTIIEDGVFIGSDTQLVAPVKVGRNATVGAGTTLWKDVSPDALVINTKEQCESAAWIRPKKNKVAK